MKDYIKPTFTLAGFFPVALAATGACYVKESEADEMLRDINPDWSYSDAAFGEIETQCGIQYPLGAYCKYTSEGEFVIIGS